MCAAKTKEPILENTKPVQPASLMKVKSRAKVLCCALAFQMLGKNGNLSKKTVP